MMSWKSGLLPDIHPGVFLFIMKLVALLSVAMYYLMEVLEEPICPVEIWMF